jgi:hypothetical protein
MDIDYDWGDEYDPEEVDAEPVPTPEPICKWFSCVRCKISLVTTLMPGMITGVGCPCGQAFMFDDAAEEHIWRGPTNGGETTAPPDDTKPRQNHVRDAVRANQ